MVNLVDIVPTLLRLQGMDVPRSMHGQPLFSYTCDQSQINTDGASQLAYACGGLQSTAPRDTESRSATFSEYGAGGPPFRLSDLEQLPKPYGRRALMQSLRWREAEGRRKMVRTREWKYVHDPMGDANGCSNDELYDLINDSWELTNVVNDPANRDVLAEMQRRLADWSIATEDARPVPLP